MWGYGHEMMWGPGYGYGIADGLVSLLWVVLMIIIIVSLIRYARGKHPMHWHGDRTALDILKERYAKGEITKEQFDQMKKDVA